MEGRDIRELHWGDKSDEEEKADIRGLSEQGSEGSKDSTSTEESGPVNIVVDTDKLKLL